MFHGISMGNYCQLPWNCGILRHLEREPTRIPRGRAERCAQKISAGNRSVDAFG